MEGRFTMQSGEVVRRTAWTLLDDLHGKRQQTLKKVNKQEILHGVTEEYRNRRLSAIMRYARENVAYMAERNPITEREASQAALFYYEAITAFWQGNMPEQRETLKKHPGYRPFFKCAKGYAYEWWLRDLIENASPLLSGFTLRW